MRVLVAEDDRSSRMVTRRLLERLGHEVAVAEDGEEAWLQITSGEVFDVIISDWLMPRLDGHRLCQRIRRRENDHAVSYTYLILLTAMTDREHMLAGFEAGTDDFLSKPVDEAELVARLRVGERIMKLEQSLEAQVGELRTANEKLHADLQAAAMVQDSILPRNLPRDKRVSFGWEYLPCEQLAGDILNVIPINPDLYGVYLLDVSGHGVAAALKSVMISRVLSNDPLGSLLLGETPEESVTSPSRVLALLNERYPIDENSSDVSFFTIVYGLLDARKGTFRYANAGHPPVMVLRNGATELGKVGGPAIGMIDNWKFDEEEIQLDDSTRVYIYSDGIIENPNEEGEQFGYDRLAELIAGLGMCSTSRGATVVAGEARAWNPTEEIDDDVSVLVFGGDE